MIMKGGSLEPPFLLPWLRKRHQANSLNLKTTFFAPLRSDASLALRSDASLFARNFSRRVRSGFAEFTKSFVKF